ncbi:MAG: porin family protein [Nitrospirae bacterium]|nr:porin family protein [Nitrospirota bacterium]
MVKKYIIAVLALVFFLLGASLASAQDQWTGNVNIFIGQKNLDKDDWEPVDKQTEFGVEIDFRKKDWPVNIAIDILRSSDDDTYYEYDPFFGPLSADVKGETTEFNIGIRKIWDGFPSIRPFIGGGLSYIRAEVEVSIPGIGSASESDTGVGIWLGGGVYFTLAEHFNLGLEIRYSDADVTIADVKGKAGGTHYGLLAGYHW